MLYSASFFDSKIYLQHAFATSRPNLIRVEAR